MQGIRRLLGNKTILALAVVYTCAITVLFLMPPPELPKVDLPGGTDKIVHLLIHFLLVFFWQLYSFRQNNYRLQRKQVVFILAGSLLYGIIIELLQGYLTVSRRHDLFDVLANFGGALTGVFTFQKIKHLFAP